MASGNALTLNVGERASQRATTNRTDGDETVAEEAKAGDAALERADKVLRAFDKSHLPIESLKDDHFDNSINTYLDERAGEE